ncbi:MAG: sugar phosphate isomerase/epimerase family protein [Planctomycetota bacterium]|jgi:sugar phosphate isomerase/epimerase
MSKWTADRIRAQLGTSTIIFPPEERLSRDHIARVADAGISCLEVGAFNGLQHYDHNDEAQVDEIAQAADDLGVKIASVHCPLVAYDNADEDTRQEASRESIAAAKAGERMGADLIVCHFHNQPPSVTTAREMLDALDGCNIRIATENGINLTPYAQFVDHFGTEKLGICIDIGHTRVPEEDWLNPFTAPGRAKAIVEDTVGSRLYHIHIHDYHNNEDHRPPWEGDIQWGDLFDSLDAINYPGALMFESLPVISPEDTLQKVGAFPDEFAKRYG